MVLLGAVVLLLFVVGIIWFAGHAWSPKGPWSTEVEGASLHERAARATFRPTWPFWVIVGVLLLLVVVLLRARALPILLLVPLLLAWKLKKDRCPTCGEAVAPRAEACLSCGTPRG